MAAAWRVRPFPLGRLPAGTSDLAAEAGGMRILSRYRTAKGDLVWVVTEAGQRATTLLLPDECCPPSTESPTASGTGPLRRLPRRREARGRRGAASGDLRDVLVFGVLTGLRPQELRELRQDQILFTAGGKPYVLIERHKTSRSAHSPRPRSVPLCPMAEEILERQVRAHPQSPRVFLNAAGGPYTRYSLRNRLRRLCRRAGLRDEDGAERLVTPYAMRHTFASIESDAGIETTSLAGLMGHSTNRTLQRYVANSFEHHRKAVGAVESQLRKILREAGS
jgi:integrase